MNKVELIIKAIDNFLEIENKLETTPVEVNPYLERKGILKDSSSRKGKPLRDILRKGEIPHAYQIGNRWAIPNSNNKSIKPKLSNNTVRKVVDNPIQFSNHKLEPIGKLIADILEKEFNIKAKHTFEYNPDWLKSFPNKDDLKDYWEKVNIVYSELIEKRYKLDIQLLKLDEKKLRSTQSFDIWFFEPYNFAIEFDEKQHFNQFRKLTLNHYGNLKTGFDIKNYQGLNNKSVKPGKSRFTKLKSKDPLFAELLEGEKQDNRIRQRAFRDFLKDLTPISKGYNPTLRIPYHVTNKKIKDFTKSDLENIVVYLAEYEIITSYNNVYKK